MHTRRALQLFAVAVALSFSALCGRAEETLRPFTPFSLEAALADAQTLAARHADAEVIRVEGRSMLPFFSDGSVLVVKSLAVTQVKPGMVIVYQNRFGDTVAHRVVASAPEGGWVVRGYNNAQTDSTVVTGSNLVGVVYATFYSNGRVSDAGQHASLSKGIRVAQAAPAK